jgi:antibiotic biosynthesis monooxygenase (ABM) superfamily enzyme
MAKDRVITNEDDVTVVVSRSVFPGYEKEYEEWSKKMVEAARESPGNTGVTMLLPTQGKPGPYHLVLRFEDEKSMHVWETSYARQKLSHEADAFSRRVRQEATGLETWFAIPECPDIETPPKWKMFLVTSLAVYIVSIIFVPLLDLIFEGVSFYLINILASLLVVGSLTWALMPWFSRYVFKRWLYR